MCASRLNASEPSHRRRLRRRQRGVAPLELLEPRLVLDSTVVFNEIMYNPGAQDESLEWIELHNQMSVDMDLSGWRLAGGVEHQFPRGTTVEGGGFLVVAADPTALQASTGLAELMGPYLGNLSNGGEEVLLINNSDRLMDSVDYGDNFPWPLEPDGSGASLAKLDRNSNSAQPDSWSTSAQIGGTPGAINFTLQEQQISQSTVVLLDDVWSYDDSGSVPDAGWQNPGFPEPGWQEGAGVLYSGNVDVPTSTAPPDSLVGYWTFDNTLVDQSVHGNHGQLLGGEFDPSVPAAIGLGRSLSLSPGDAGVRVAADNSLNSNVFTLAYWLNDPGQLNGSGVSNGETGHNRVTSRTSDTFETAVNNSPAAGGSSRAKFYSGGWRDTPIQLQSNSWTHVAYVYDGATLEVYADGALMLTQAVAINPSGDFFIGARHTGVENFVGKIDDVALWSEALESAAIQALANGSATPATINADTQSELLITSNLDDWRQSTETIDGGATGTWNPSGDPAPPDASTFTLVPTATSAGEIPHINTAAAGLGVTGISTGNNTSYFRTTFDLPAYASISANLQLAVDNGAQVYINGQLLATETSFVVDNWAAPLPSVQIGDDGAVLVNKFDSNVASFDAWVEGENEIVLAVRNPNSEVAPAGGFAFKMDVRYEPASTAGQGLFGYWPLEETSGTQAPNSAPGGAAGSLFNGVTWANDAERGRVLQFDGVDGYVNAGTLPAINIDDDFSWSFWSRQEQAAPPSRPNDVILGNRFPDSGWIKFTPTTFEYRNNPPTYINNIDYPDISPALGWLHHAVVKQGDQMTYYRDGIALGTSTATQDISPLPFYFGGDTTNENWQGMLDDIAVWQAALPEASVAGLSTGEFSPLTAPTSGSGGGGPRQDIADFGWRRLDEDFSSDTIDSATFEVIEYGLENRGEGTGTDFTADTTTQTDQVTIAGTANISYWGGKSLRTVEMFDSSLPAEITVNRVSLTGTGTAYRSSLWLWANDGNYLHFSQNVGENGWQFNANNIGGVGTASPTGGGNNLGLFDALDGDLGQHEMKLVYTPAGDGSASIDMYVDDVLGATHRVSNWPGQFQVMVTGQARQAGDTVSAVFDDLHVSQTVRARFETQLDDVDTAYLRKEFLFSGDPARTTLEMLPIVDDGAVFYLNGIEVLRYNMPAGAVEHDTAAVSEVTDSPVAGRFQIAADSLVQGSNVLAVELHRSAGSDDSLFAATLEATVAPPPQQELGGLLQFSETELHRDPIPANSTFFVELVNQTSESIDVAGYAISSTNEADPTYTLPAQTLNTGDYLVIDQADLGFLPDRGDRLFLLAPNQATVADAVEIEAGLQARSPQYGRRWLLPDVATPGTPNSFQFNTDIVINEILYHAPGLPPDPGVPAVYDTQTLVPIDAVWRHSKGATVGVGDLPVNLGANWDDQAHPVDGVTIFSGQAPFGYETAALPVAINTQFGNPQTNSNFITTYYFEIEFGLTQAQINAMDELALTHMVDDGAVFYVNGQEVQRFNMPSGTPTFSTFAVTGIGEAALSTPTALSASSLVALPAMNRLSVELHQRATGSSDVVFAAQLDAREIVTPGTPPTPFSDNPEQWLELYNRGGSAVDLSGWSFTDGISYQFQPGAVLQPGEYLVVANDASALLAEHPGINALGNFGGSLNRGGERIELSDAQGNPVDIVDYRDGGRWHDVADGGGSSLELRDPFADNSLPEAWAASDESVRAEWQTITYRGVATNTVGPTLYNELVLGLLDAGEVLLDDIQVVENPDGAARQLIQNGTFEADALGQSPATWRIIGTHDSSQVVLDPDDPSNQVLRLTATGSTEHMHNHAETTLKDGASFVTINSGLVYEISFRARWVEGANLFNSRLYFNRLQRTTPLTTPDLHGTPGAVNSTFESNIGPTYRGFGHQPAVPLANQEVTVSVMAEDPNDVVAMTIQYSADGGAFNGVAMTHQGGGLYTGAIPGQSSGAVVQFYVQGQDALGAVSTYPAAGADSRALFKVQDNQASSLDINNFRIIMTTEDANWLHTLTNVMSNDRLGATVIYNETDVFYDLGVRLKGSERGRFRDVRVGFNVRFDPLDLFRGVHATVGVDRSGAGDQFSQKEILVRHTITAAGDIPGAYDDLIHVVAPRATHTGSAMLQLARFNDVYLDSQFENGADGRLFEYELIYYPTTTTGGPEGLKVPTPDSVTGVPMASRGDNKENYRWNFLIKNNRAADDYSGLMTALGAIGLASGTEFHEQTAELLDVDEWLRAFAVQVLWGIGDNYTFGAQHNAQFYVRPEDGKLLFFPWDLDFTASQGSSASLTPNGEQQKMLTLPENRHDYYGHLHDIVTTTFNPTYLDPWIEHYDSFLPAESFGSFMTYVAQRSSFALSGINSAVPSVPFNITTNGGAGFSVDETFATLAGTGWVNVRDIRLAGHAAPLQIDWTTSNQWQLNVPVASGVNQVTLEAYDFQGALIGSDTITITSSADNPLTDYLRISEVHYHPADPSESEFAAGHNDADDFEFVELVNTSDTFTLNLEGAAFITGIDYTFPAGASLAPGQRLVVVRDQAAFEARYGTGLPVAGEYSGGLANGGEELLLVDAFSAVIANFEYSDNGQWPGRADGGGSSLEILDTQLDGNDPDSWRSSTEYHGSPGAAGIGDFTDVVVNEVMSHTDPPQVDAIELYNASAGPVDVSGWFLSDSNNNYQKFAIPDGTVMQPGEYLVFDEDDFNPTPLNPGPNDFALNGAHGDDVWLLAVDGAGSLSRFADHVDFGAQANAESWGRRPNGEGDLYPMLTLTLDAVNSGPRVGPVVINEIMYNPLDPDGVGPLTGEQMEFVELLNPTDEAVDLTGWQLNAGIDFEFPTGLMLEEGGLLVVVGFDPEDALNSDVLAAFRAAYGIDQATPLLGGFNGRLDNGGERVQLLRPDEPPLDEPNFTPLLLEDEVRYDSDLPWPQAADGGGFSLTRIAADAWGNTAESWMGVPPTPGSVITGPPVVVSVDVNAGISDPADLPSQAQPTSWLIQQSAIRSIVVTFSKLIVASVDDLRLTNLGLDADNDPDMEITLSDDHFSLGSNQIILRFAAGELEDGVYQLEVLPGVVDLDSVQLDGNQDGTPGDAYDLNGSADNGLFQLTGDWNGSAGVTIFDFPTFAYWFGVSTPAAPDYVDLNGDGGITIFDFPDFADRFGDSPAFPTPLRGSQVNAILVDAGGNSETSRLAERNVREHPIAERIAAVWDELATDRPPSSRGVANRWSQLADRVADLLGQEDREELDLGELLD